MVSKESTILASVGAVVVNYSTRDREFFIKGFVSSLRKMDVSLTPYVILGYVHEIYKEVNIDLWTRILSKSKTAKSNGLYTEFEFKEGNATNKAHYINGQKYARVLTSSSTRYTGRLLSVEEDGVYLNHKKIEVL